MATFHRTAFLPAAVVLPLAVAFVASSISRGVGAQEISTAFSGGAVPSGTVRHSLDHGKHVLTLSDNFSIHDEPPDPHWRAIDSSGNVFLLDKLKIEGNKINTSIVLPAYIHDVAKVQMWCAFAEVVLGEVAFPKPIALK